VGTSRQKETQAPGVTDLVGRLVDDLGQLISQHVALARLELGEEARSMGRVATSVALVVPLFLVGYALLCFGVALALDDVMGLTAAVFLVGGVNILIGLVALLVARQALKRQHLPGIGTEVRKSAQLLVTQASEEETHVH
jgi:uncharacterized membrane protein YqjE